jgi:hypothetical protein
MTLASGCIIGGRVALSSLLDLPGKCDVIRASAAALFPTTSITMPTSNLYTKESQMVEVGDTNTGDEAELARMGYRQELQCVQFSLSIHPRLLKFVTR